MESKREKMEMNGKQKYLKNCETIEKDEKKIVEGEGKKDDDKE